LGITASSKTPFRFVELWGLLEQACAALGRHDLGQQRRAKLHSTV
jgi:hypothetical protein